MRNRLGRHWISGLVRLGRVRRTRGRQGGGSIGQDPTRLPGSCVVATRREVIDDAYDQQPRKGNANAPAHCRRRAGALADEEALVHSKDKNSNHCVLQGSRALSAARSGQAARSAVQGRAVRPALIHVDRVLRS
jgi:hypothetical protein